MGTALGGDVAMAVDRRFPRREPLRYTGRMARRVSEVALAESYRHLNWLRQAEV
jgi:hypothetical protein